MVSFTTFCESINFREQPLSQQLEHIQVTIDEIAANNWSLTPGRYVGAAPEEVDEAFAFEETLREIHVELEDLNRKAITLAATINRNFVEAGI